MYVRESFCYCPSPVRVPTACHGMDSTVSGRTRRIQAPKQGIRYIGRVNTQQALRTEHRALGKQLGQWQASVGATDMLTQTDVAHARYVSRQLDVNSRAAQTY